MKMCCSLKVYVTLVLSFMFLAITFLVIPIYAQEVTINFISTGGGAAAAWRPIVDKFNEDFKGEYYVDYTNVTHEALKEKLMLQFMTKTPLYDVFAVHDTWILEVAQYLEPLDDYAKLYGPTDPEETFGGLINGLKDADGKLLSLPVRSGPQIFYYREDFLEEVGLEPPKNLDEIVEAARLLTKKDDSGDISRFGMALKLESAPWTIEVFGGYFMAQGGRILSPDLTKADDSIKGPAAHAVMKMMKTLWDEKLIPDPLGWTYHDGIAAFQTERLAMTDDTSVRVAFIEDPNESKAAGKMGYSVLPGTLIGPYPIQYTGFVWGLSINKQSDTKKKEGAYQLMEYMTRYENQKIMALEYGNGPTILALFDDPDFAKINPAADAIKEAYKAGMQTYTPVPQGSELHQIIHEEIQKMIVGNISIEEACENIYDRINKVMEK